MDSLLNSKRMFDRIDEKTKCLVNGYIRELESEMQSEQRNVNCPQEINDLCTLFAHTPPEQFVKSGDCLVLDSVDHPLGMKNTATLQCDAKKDSNWKSVIGEYDVDCKVDTNAVYEWTIFVSADLVSIGIVSTKNEDKISGYVDQYAFSTYEGTTFYALGNGGRLEHQDKKIAVVKEDRYEDVGKTANGDLIKMTLDTRQMTLSFNKNGKDIGVAYENIDDGHTYNLAVSCFTREGFTGQFVKLVDFGVQRSH